MSVKWYGGQLKLFRGAVRKTGSLSLWNSAGKVGASLQEKRGSKPDETMYVFLISLSYLIFFLVFLI